MAQPSQVGTFVFTDLEGSTRLWEEHPGTMGAALAEHDAILSGAIEAHGGTVIKSMGDGGFAVFDAPDAAVGAAAAVTRDLSTRTWPGIGSLRPRIGIHTGQAETRNGDYFGPALNRASRLMSAAHAGQVVVSQRTAELVREALPDGLMLLDLGEHRFVGLTRAERVYQLAIAGLPTLFPPLESLGAFPGVLALPLPAFARGEEQLSGRTSELEHLQSVAHQAAAGGRRTVVIGGEPGIGKTRLAGELVRRAASDGTVALYGRSDEDPICSYQPFAEALRPFIAASSAWMLRECLHGLERDLVRLFPELLGRIPSVSGPGPTDPETARYRLFEAVSTLLAAIATTQPTILVLDDLHAADKPTLQLLRHVDRATADARLLVVGCYRDVQLPPSHPLVDYLADLRKDARAERVMLTGLTEEQSFRLVAEQVGADASGELVTALHAATQGNPFFLEELVRHVTETNAPLDLATLGLPESVREVVARRLRRLPEPVRGFLEFAAIGGREFDAKLVARAAERPVEEVLGAFDDAADARIVAHDPERVGHYAFTNAIVRQALHNEIPRARRVRLHARVGTAMEADRSEHNSAELALHFREAVLLVGPEKAIRYTSRAGREAAADFAFEDAVAYFDQALSMLEDHARDDDAAKVELLIDRASAMVYVDERSGVLAAREAVKRARTDGTATQFGRAVAVFVEPMYGAAAFPDETRRLFDEARAALGDTDPALQARLLAYEAFKYAVHQLRGRDGRALAQQSVALAREAADSLTLADALLALAVNIEGTADVEARVQLGEELVALGRTAGGRASAFGLRVLAGARLELAQGDELTTTIAALTRLGEKLRWLPAKVYGAQWQATRAMLEGRWDDVRAHRRDLRRYAQAYSGAAGMEQVQGFLVARELGADSIATGVRVEDVPGADIYACASILLADVDAGDLDTARAGLNSLAAEGYSRGAMERRGAALGVLAEVAASVDAREHAAPIYEALAPHTGHLLSVILGLSCIGAADRYLGMLATLLGRWDDAEAHFARAYDVEVAVNGSALLPRTRYWNAIFLLSRGRPGDLEAARSLLEAASAESGQLGMQRLHAQCAALSSR